MHQPTIDQRHEAIEGSRTLQCSSMLSMQFNAFNHREFIGGRHTRRAHTHTHTRASAREGIPKLTSAQAGREKKRFGNGSRYAYVTYTYPHRAGQRG